MDAIVAFVDEELSPGARERALSHLAGCGECAAQVVGQTQARLALRASAVPSLPSSLLRTLHAIPREAELPDPSAELAVASGGELVSVVRWPRPAVRRRLLDRRFRVGAGAVLAGLALGAWILSALPDTLADSPAHPPGQVASPPSIQLVPGPEAPAAASLSASIVGPTPPAHR
ncbi:MAG: zf-HC2 domain-containing protein [Pseudonocardia sp.]|nr:zf-HC2 domain-containing protein [Pseudonocardia sp.]